MGCGNSREDGGDGAGGNASGAPADYFPDDEEWRETEQFYAPEEMPLLPPASRDKNDYKVANLEGGQVVVRPPGSIQGQMFRIEDCTDATIILCDHTAQVTVDECVNCRIVIGPCQGSLFVRTCTDCVVVAACQQFRSRDCTNVDVFLYTFTQPIVETSVNMRFGCYRFFYPLLKTHFDNAGLSVFVNQWWNVYDFNASEGDGHWSLLDADAEPPAGVLPTDTDEVELASLSPRQSVVPVTAGTHSLHGASVEVLVVILPSDRAFQVFHFIHKLMVYEGTDAVLVRTNERTLSKADVGRMFTVSSAIATRLRDGSVVGMHLAGDSAAVRERAEEAVARASRHLGTAAAFVSETASELDAFFEPAADDYRGTTMR